MNFIQFKTSFVWLFLKQQYKAHQEYGFDSIFWRTHDGENNRCAAINDRPWTPQWVRIRGLRQLVHQNTEDCRKHCDTNSWRVWKPAGHHIREHWTGQADRSPHPYCQSGDGRFSLFLTKYHRDASSSNSGTVRLLVQEILWGLKVPDQRPRWGRKTWHLKRSRPGGQPVSLHRGNWNFASQYISKISPLLK